MPGMLASYLLEKMPTTGPMLITLMRLSEYGVQMIENASRSPLQGTKHCTDRNNFLFSSKEITFASHLSHLSTLLLVKGCSHFKPILKKKKKDTLLMWVEFPGGSDGKESARNVGDLGLIPGLGRAPGEGKGYPLQCSGLENSMDCIVHGVAKSQTRPSDFHFTSLHWWSPCSKASSHSAILFRAFVLIVPRLC